MMVLMTTIVLLTLHTATVQSPPRIKPSMARMLHGHAILIIIPTLVMLKRLAQHSNDPSPEYLHFLSPGIFWSDLV